MKSLIPLRDEFLDTLGACNFCPRSCGVNRLNDEKGFCKTGRRVKVSSAFLHFGEEPELVGRRGSGTIFFSNCNLGCIYCQNYTISHFGQGTEVESGQLADTMLGLQRAGAENINFVTPTHVVPQILEALCIAVGSGINSPLVYNCGGYESPQVISKLEGVFDIYMPDVKYSDSKNAGKYSSAQDYWEVEKEVLKEMHRQVGDLVVEGGVARRGLLIRHLVLPQNLAGSFKILDFIKEQISPNTYVNIMQQYRPCFQAGEFKELSRRISAAEYLEVVSYARKLGLSRGF